jgi:hypothetical protein
MIIGNITKVRWHTYLKKISAYNYGHCQTTFYQNNHTSINETMEPNVNYAMVLLDASGVISVRNLFNSHNINGFDQKNTYFADKISNNFIVDDCDNVLLNYIKLAFPYKNDITNTPDIEHLLYYCVEYKMYENTTCAILQYCVELENKFSSLEKRLTDIEAEQSKQNNKDKQNKDKCSFFTFLRF